MDLLLDEDRVEEARLAAQVSGAVLFVHPGGNRPEGPALPTWELPEHVIADPALYAFPSGLVLPRGQLPWVWLVSVKCPPYVEYVQGTAEEVARYAAGVAPILVAPPAAVSAADLMGPQVRVHDEGGEYFYVEARPLPAWTRPNQAPRHEEWPGVPLGAKVWPVVPSGFTTDFAFRF